MTDDPTPREGTSPIAAGVGAGIVIGAALTWFPPGAGHVFAIAGVSIALFLIQCYSGARIRDAVTAVAVALALGLVVSLARSVDDGLNWGTAWGPTAIFAILLGVGGARLYEAIRRRRSANGAPTDRAATH